MIDPFERACKIRRGELDDEMPAFEELTGWFIRCPDTWLPGLLKRIVVQCVIRKVFQDGGLERVVQRSIEIGKNPSAAILRGDE